jgi:hypothetical protein
MSSRPRLVLDDPLDGPPPPPPPEPEHHPEPAPRRRPRATTKPRTAVSPAPQSTPTPDPIDSHQPEANEWRDWAGPKRVASFRLPDELLDEINTTSDQLGIPIGHLVIAGLTSVLDQPDDEITALADRVAQTLLRGKRNARRKKATEAATSA